jgi:hypothetical protein
MVLFVASLGRRIEEATGLQPDDLDENNVLHIRRVVYEGEVEVLEKEQLLPLDSVVRAPTSSAAFVRWESVGNGCSSPVRGRRPIPATSGVKIGRWHDSATPSRV